MSGRLNVREAWCEAEEARSWTCRTCVEPSDDGSPYCRSCGDYWAAVADGMFDHEALD